MKHSKNVPDRAASFCIGTGNIVSQLVDDRAIHIDMNRRRISMSIVTRRSIEEIAHEGKSYALGQL